MNFRCPIAMAIAIPIPMPTVAFPAALSGSYAKATGFAGAYVRCHGFGFRSFNSVQATIWELPPAGHGLTRAKIYEGHPKPLIDLCMPNKEGPSPSRSAFDCVIQRLYLYTWTNLGY